MQAPTADTVAEALRPLTEAPDRAAVMLDIDGTLAPIVERAEDAAVPQSVSRRLAALSRRYRLVACISGRSAAEAKRLVGVGGIAYAGSHGAELLEPGAEQPGLLPELDEWTARVREFAVASDSREMRTLRVRREDKGPIVAYHWRGAPDEDAARARVDQIAVEAESAGLATHWGRKVLEVRPPVPFDKGRAVEALARGVHSALYAGDDTTDLDAFAALERLRDSGDLDAIVRVGIASEEGPAAIVEHADLVVDGPAGLMPVLDAL